MVGGKLTSKERGALWIRLSIRLVLAVLAVLALWKLGPPLLSLFAPFVVAAVAASLLNRPVRWFQRKIGGSRQVITLILLLLLLGAVGTAIGFLGYTAGNELLSLIQNWDVMLDELLLILDNLEEMFAQLLALLPEQVTGTIGEALVSLAGWLKEAVPATLSRFAAHVGQTALGVPSVVVAVIVFIMATYFLTSDYPYLRDKCVQHMDKDLRRFAGQVRNIVVGAFGGYLKAQLLLSVGVFFILLAGFSIIHQSYGVLLAFLFSLMDFIPVIGAGTIMVPWAVICLFTRDFAGALELMVIWGIIVLFRRIMEPKFVGDQTGLPTILSLISIYVGMRLGGILGMILGPIVMLIILNLVSMGIFRGVRLDLTAMVRDISSILSQRPESR